MKKHMIIFGRIRDGKYCRMIYKVGEDGEHIFEQAVYDENVLKRGLQKSEGAAIMFIESFKLRLIDEFDFTVENEQLEKVTKVQCFIQDELQAMNGGGWGERKANLLKIKNILK